MTIEDNQKPHNSSNENTNLNSNNSNSNNNNNNNRMNNPQLNSNNPNNNIADNGTYSPYTHNYQHMHNTSTTTNRAYDQFEENKSMQMIQEINENNKNSLPYEIGEHVDCKDTVNHWLNAEIIAVKNNCVRVHYTGWSKKYDEWIEANSDRIIKQWKRGMKFKLNNRIDVIDEKDTWLEARVIDIKDDYIKIHFFRFHSKYDTWIQIDSNRIAEIGSHSNAYGAAKFAKMNTKAAKRHKHMAQILDEETFQKKMNEKGLFIKQMGGDGNCLFRAFSDQLYGHEEYHQSIREICMDYLSYEREFFKNFVVGGEEKFDYYIERKREDGVWGDDIEIQALSEIYSRSIEIYAYSNEPMRTFHEAYITISEPIRISYHGRSHYNSIKRIGKENEGLLQGPFGQIEDIALRNAKLRYERLRVQQRDNNNIVILDESDQIINHIINQSRVEFENAGKRDMEAALEESLAMYDQEMMNKGALPDDEINNVMETSIQNKYEEDMLKIVMEESKKEQEIETDEIIRNVIDQSKRDIYPDDNLMDATIKEVVSLGFPLEMVIEAYSLVGDDPNAIVNMLTENYGYGIY